MAEPGDYRLGSIWLVTFDPAVGTEIRKTRPALVISGSVFNAQRSKVTVLPFTSARPKDPRINPAVVVVSSKESKWSSGAKFTRMCGTHDV